jgi:SAM-dependent methyltransferase
LSSDKGWESIYAVRGEVQSAVLGTAVQAAERFKAHGCRRVMDLGCGTGRHTVYLAQRGFHVFAGDIAPTGVMIASEKARAMGLQDVRFIQLDMTRIPLSRDCVDGILCIWTTGHGRLEDVRRNVDEMCRVLRPGGLVIADYVSVEDEDCGRGREIEANTFLGGVKGEEHIPHHYSSRAELEELFARFTAVQIRPITYTLRGWKDIEAFLVEAIT